MDAPEPNKKRLRRISDQLDAMVRVDIVKELGDRGLEGAVYGILRHLTLAEIWEVISYSPPLRQWMHRRGIWKKLAEDRIPDKRLTKVTRKLGRSLSRTRGINYMWILLAIESQIFETREGTVMRKWKTVHGKTCVQITEMNHDEGVLSSFEEAFPNGHDISANVLEKNDMRGKRAVLAVIEITPDNFDKTIFRHVKNDDETAFIVFWYLILAGGGEAMVKSFKEGMYGLSQEVVVDTLFFEAAYNQINDEHFEPAVLLPQDEETYKTIRSEAFHY